jgi:hypothetical protein
MKITKRRVNSVSEVTAKMDALAREAALVDHCYDESAAESMTEFDALRWKTLCSQRKALLSREEAQGSAMPSSFRLMYGAATHRSSSLLENAVDGLNKLAA